MVLPQQLKVEPGVSWLKIVFGVVFGLVIASQTVAAAVQPVGDVTTLLREKNGVVCQLSSRVKAEVRFVTADVVRVRVIPPGIIEEDWSYAVNHSDQPPPAITVAETGTTIKLAAPGGATVMIERKGFLLTVLDAAGKSVVTDDPARPTAFDSQTGEIETSKQRTPTELYYGFGEKALPLSRHDQFLVMWNTDTYGYPVGTDPIYQTIPFFIALSNARAYGVFVDNTYRSFFDMGKTNPNRYTFGVAGGILNYYVFTGGETRSPEKIVAAYAAMTGRGSLPPLWALGFQQSRWSYHPEARVREIADNFRRRKIPADTIYLDIDYMDGFRVFTWDKKRFPDPKKLISDLRQDGFRTVVIIDPGIKVDDKYGVYQSGQAGNHFVKTADGKEFQATVWPGTCAFPDFTNPQARAWFGSHYAGNLDDGISGFWNDMNEPATFLPWDLKEPNTLHHPLKTFPLTNRHAGDGHPGDHARYHNVYGMQMARATFEGLRNLRPNLRPFVLTRAGYAGIQRYSAIWTGDNVASWDHLALSIPMLTNLSISGVSLVGADVGGFSGNPSAELNTRWMQAAALTPMYRSHTEAGSNDQEPWAFGPEFEKINRQAIELRYQLLPYLYSQFHNHEQTGQPVMRPLWYQFPHDQNTYLIDDQYLIGSDLLVAPVVKQGATKRRVYFPAGTDWIDWWTGIRMTGGNWVEVEAPIERLPLFVRAGAVLPTQPIVQNTGEMANQPLFLTIAAGNNQQGEFFEDAGEGYGYRQGEFRLVKTVGTTTELKFQSSGKFAGRAIQKIELIGLEQPPKAVLVNGKESSTVEFDAARKRLVLTVSALPETVTLRK
ncbi:MAG: DUF4968 domain-containing protein [Acidobacteria bacterium]|nr:DUF4968 domain-containing protein [Acidobacteriota bacterium]